MVSPTKLAWLLLGGLLLASGAMAAGTSIITCCEDANGRRICADVLPPACYGREYREISPQGTVTRVVPAPMTAEERARAEQENKAREAAEDKAREERRRDAALLQTYSSLEDLETQRQRAVADIEQDLEEARRREAEVLKRRAKLEQEAEFYLKKPRPPELANALRDNDSELAAQRSVIDSKQRDLDAVKARYDNDRRRYTEIQAQRAGGRR
jgi:hypothetical protein